MSKLQAQYGGSFGQWMQLRLRGFSVCECAAGFQQHQGRRGDHAADRGNPAAPVGFG
jgi:hypothetical protein